MENRVPRQRPQRAGWLKVTSDLKLAQLAGEIASRSSVTNSEITYRVHFGLGINWVLPYAVAILFSVPVRGRGASVGVRANRESHLFSSWGMSRLVRVCARVWLFV